MDRLDVAFDDLKEGDEGPAWSLENLTRSMFVRYAGASGDFNPMHHDDTIAQAVGYPSVFGHGMFTAGVLSHYLTDWFGTENLRKYKVRFRKQVWPGDTLTLKSKVLQTYSQGGDNLVDVEANVVNEKGEVVLEGWATAAPSK